MILPKGSQNFTPLHVLLPLAVGRINQASQQPPHQQILQIMWLTRSIRYRVQHLPYHSETACEACMIIARHSMLDMRPPHLVQTFPLNAPMILQTITAPSQLLLRNWSSSIRSNGITCKGCKKKKLDENSPNNHLNQRTTSCHSLPQ